MGTMARFQARQKRALAPRKYAHSFMLMIAMIRRE